MAPLRPDGSFALEANVVLGAGTDGKSIFLSGHHVREVPAALQEEYGTPRQLTAEEVGGFLRGCAAINQGIVAAHKADHPGGPELQMFGPTDMYGTCPTIFFGWYNEDRASVIISPELSPETARIKGGRMDPFYANSIPPELIPDWGHFANRQMLAGFREEYVAVCRQLGQAKAEVIGTSPMAEGQGNTESFGGT